MTFQEKNIERDNFAVFVIVDGIQHFNQEFLACLSYTNSSWEKKGNEHDALSLSQ
jgi:hypothetical protein